MNIAKNIIDDVNAQLVVSIEEADYADRVTKVLKDYQKKASIPGFRPGKVPTGLLRKQYGKSVTLDEVNKLMGEAINDFLENAEFKVLGEPLPSEDQEVVDLDNAKDFEFKFDIAMAPEVEVKLTKRDKIKNYKVIVTEDMIEKQIAGYGDRFGEQVDVDTAEETDLVKGTFVELDENGEIKEAGILKENAIVAPDRIKDEAVKGEFIGAQIDTVIKFNPMAALENATEVASLLSISKEEAEALTSTFSFKVTSISRYQKAEINEELYKKVYGEEVTTKEDFEARVKADIEKGFERDADYRFTLDARDKVIAKVGDISLPEAFLKRWLLIKNEKDENFTEEKLEADFPKVIEGLKWDLAKSQIAKENEVKVQEEDVMTFAKEMARMQFAQYGMSNIGDEHVESYAKEMLKDQQQSQNIVERAFEEKIVACIKEKVKVEDTDIELDDFNKLFEQN